MKRILLLIVFVSAVLMFPSDALSEVFLAPDGSGTYVGGLPNLSPHGAYVGGTPTITLDGTYVDGQPKKNPLKKEKQKRKIGN